MAVQILLHVVSSHEQGCFVQVYAGSAFEDLLGRFEAPIGTNRWDSPLFTVDTATDTGEQIRAVLASVVRYLTCGGQGAGKQEQSEAQLDASVMRDLQPNAATRPAAHRGAAWLQETDSMAQAVVQQLTAAQDAVGPGLALGSVQVMDCLFLMFQIRSLRCLAQKAATTRFRRHALARS